MSEHKKQVHIEFYHPKYQQQLKDYLLPKEQQVYTAMPVRAIERGIGKTDYHPVLIIYNQQIAGFFVLDGGDDVKELVANSNAILLRSYSVDINFQGLGIASQSLQLLPAFVEKHFPTINEIVLGVNHQNHVAQTVYMKNGFIDKGKRIVGKLGEQFVYHLDLNRNQQHNM